MVFDILFMPDTKTDLLLSPTGGVPGCSATMCLLEAETKSTNGHRSIPAPKHSPLLVSDLRAEATLNPWRRSLEGNAELHTDEEGGQLLQRVSSLCPDSGELALV
jgi:hypothetical protein